MASHFIVGHRAGWLPGDVSRAVVGGPCRRRATVVHNRIASAQIIHANLSANHMQVFTSQRLGARSSDLLTVIAELPARREPSALS
jgi:hypothetical protein